VAHDAHRHEARELIQRGVALVLEVHRALAARGQDVLIELADASQQLVRLPDLGIDTRHGIGRGDGQTRVELIELFRESIARLNTRSRAEGLAGSFARSANEWNRRSIRRGDPGRRRFADGVLDLPQPLL
jgi:hypothetical protein